MIRGQSSRLQSAITITHQDMHFTIHPTKAFRSAATSTCRAGASAGRHRARLQGIQGLGLLSVARRSARRNTGCAVCRFNMSRSGIGEDPETFDRLDLFEHDTYSSRSPTCARRGARAAARSRRSRRSSSAIRAAAAWRCSARATSRSRRRRDLERDLARRPLGRGDEGALAARRLHGVGERADEADDADVDARCSTTSRRNRERLDILGSGATLERADRSSSTADATRACRSAEAERSRRARATRRT